jgi:hypothetical protein
MIKHLLILTFVIFTISNLYSQRQIQLTNLTSEKKLFLKVGDRVQYVLKEGGGAIGVIKAINDNSIQVEDVVLETESLKSIGRRKKGAGFWAFTSSAVGVGLIIGSIQSANSDPCPNCIDAGSSGEGWTAVEIGLGVAILAVGLNGAIRNSPRNVVSKWKLEIVNQ